MASSDNARKLLIRTALVTGSTVATLFGAQTLAVMDAQTFSELLTPTAAIGSPDAVQPEVIAVTPAVTVVIHRAAPNVTILRRPGTVSSTDGQATAPQTNGSALAIRPPSPVVLANPAPVIVQQAGGQVASAPSAPVIVQQPPPSKSRPSR